MSFGFGTNTAGIGHVGAIYTLSGTTLTFVTGTDTNTDTAAYSAAFATMNFVSAPTLSVTTYALAIIVKAVGKGSNNNSRFDTGAANQGGEKTSGITYPTVPASVTSVTQNTRMYSYYVDYTPSGGGTTTLPLRSLLGVGL